LFISLHLAATYRCNKMLLLLSSSASGLLMPSRPPRRASITTMAAECPRLPEVLQTSDRQTATLALG